MNTLYEYIDPIVSSYEAFCFDSNETAPPIPAHWHYYAEILYILEGTARVTIDNAVKICPQDAVILFPPRCVHTIDFADRTKRLRNSIRESFRRNYRGILPVISPVIRQTSRIFARRFRALTQPCIRAASQRSRPEK